jgi:NAD(P)-dependent dehydrogenase (short-subunit alcohol dehydrogenase family)
MKRAGTAGEVADSILFLLSEQARYVTGTILRVTGGR